MNINIANTPGLLGADFVRSLGEPIETSDEAISRMARVFDSVVKSGRVKVDDARRTDAICVDAAEVFFTSSLEQMMTSITRAPSSTTYMVPGPDQLLPVRQTIAPGQETIAYDIETPTGQASFVAPDGMRRLNQVGEFSERKKHRSDWTGIGYGFGLVESWQAAQKGGVALDVSRAAIARNELARFNERLFLYGDVSHEIPGLLSNSNCQVKYLGTGFAGLTDPDDAYLRLQIMHKAFSRAAKSYGGSIDRVIAPADDLAKMQLLRYGTAGEGAQFIKEAMASFSWLNNVTWIDGLETAASTGGALWQMWSQDDMELWSEMSASPMLFGPFTDGELRTSFALISHVGGVINRRPERMQRFEFAA